MATWVYEARDGAGKIMRGTHDAPDRRTALEFLRAQGLFLTRLEAGRSASPSPARPLRPAIEPLSVPPIASPVAESVASPEVVPVTESAFTASVASAQAAARLGVSSVGNAPASAPRFEPRSVSGQSNPAIQSPRSASAPLQTQWLLRCTSKELSLYFRQLGAMVHAGTSIGAALHAMGSDAPSSALRQASRQMEVRALSGEPVSESMRAFPGLFTPLHIGLLSAGERGGFLDDILTRLSTYSERDYELQQSVKRETWYPKLLVFASFLIPSLVPTVLAVVQKTGNPFVAWLHSVAGPFIFLGLIYAVYRIVTFSSPLVTQAQEPRRVLDAIKLSLPVAGKVVRGLATAKFCRALGALYGAGVGAGESVRLASEACGNAAIAKRAIEIIPRLERGETLTDSLASTGYFNSSTMQMMRVGEQTGSMDEQLDKTADFLEMDAETAIKQAVKVWGILIFLGVAAYIGVQVGQFYAGYYNDILKMAEG